MNLSFVVFFNLILLLFLTHEIKTIVHKIKDFSEEKGLICDVKNLNNIHAEWKIIFFFITALVLVFLTKNTTLYSTVMVLVIPSLIFQIISFCILCFSVLKMFSAYNTTYVNDWLQLLYKNRMQEKMLIITPNDISIFFKGE